MEYLLSCFTVGLNAGVFVWARSHIHDTFLLWEYFMLTMNWKSILYKGVKKEILHFFPVSVPTCIFCYQIREALRMKYFLMKYFFFFSLQNQFFSILLR